MSQILPRYVYDSGSGNVIIDFTAPIAADPKEQIRANVQHVFGGTGIRQSNHKYNETVRVLEHEFITEAEIDAVILMMDTWVLLGNTFDFYEDQTVTGVFTTVQLVDRAFAPVRMNKKLDIWRFRITVREEIT